MSSNLHPFVEKIRSLLEEKDIKYDFFEHDSVVTSEEAAKVRSGYSLPEGGKALILSVDGEFIQIVIPGDKKYSASKLKKLLGIKSIRFAESHELEKITNGMKKGGIPPFGNLFSLPVYADNSVFSNKRIIFNCGDRCASIGMSVEDYKSLVNPKIVDII